MSVKISELPILDSLADNDIVAGVDVSGNVTSKIEMSTLKNYIDTNTQYTAGTNIDITNNVISAPDVYNKDEMDNQIEELQSEVDSLSTIFNAFPTESGEGESLTLDDTAEVKFKKFDLKGNTSQDGTPTPTSPIPVNVVSGDNEINVCGKNLFNKDSVSIGYLKEDGTLSTDTAYRTSAFMPIRPNTTYYKTSTGSPRIKYFDINKVPLNTTTYWDVPTGGSAGTFTTPNNAYYLRFSFPFTGSGAIDAGTIMVKEGTDTTYEPYQGNTYNIDLPVENLFDNSTTTNVLIADDGTERANNNVRTSTYIKVNENEPYAFSCKILEGQTQGWQKISYYDKDKNYLTYLYFVNQTRTITLPTNCKYVRIGYHINFVKNVQFEKGSKANSYTPYGTTPIELCKIGNYQDYFYKDSGKWYLHKEIGEKHFTSTNTNMFGIGTNTNYTALYISKSSIGTTSGIWIPGVLLCSHFGEITNASNIAVGKFRTNGNGDNADFYLPTSVTTLAEAKTYMDSLTNSKIYYRLATPTNTEITYQPLIDQLNLIEKAISYDSQTNISQVNNDLGFIIYAEAIKSLENVLDRIELLES